MNSIPFTSEDVKLLNSKIGLRGMLKQEKNISYPKTLRYVQYEEEIMLLQAELIKLQAWVVKNNKSVVLIFEGRDAAGKGGAIRRVTANLNPRQIQQIALPKPTKDEKLQWYFQRYVNVLPKPGEMVFFDRSWYNRAVVEPVNEFCTEKEYNIFMGQVNEFEKMISESNILIIKIYLSITKREQKKRFDAIKSNPLKKWKMTPVDERAQELWDKYTEYKKRMFAQTNTKICSWKIIKANRKTQARIAVIKHILKTVPYKDGEETI